MGTADGSSGGDPAAGASRPLRIPVAQRRAGPAGDPAVIELVAALTRRMGGSLELQVTLEELARAVVETLGFAVAAVNLVTDTGDLEVRAVVGPPDVRATLLGAVQPADSWNLLLATAEPWGRLHFLDHRDVDANAAAMLAWVPDLPVSADPEAWHPEDALFAVLRAPDGEQLGVLSVDLPADGRRPGPQQRQLLELFAEQAAVAIQHARLFARLSHSEQLFRGVYDRSPVAIAVLTPDGRYLRVNDAYCRLLDRDRDRIEGRRPPDFTHPADLVPTDRPAAAGQSAAGTGQSAAAGTGEIAALLEKRFLRPDGSIVWGRVHEAPLPSGTLVQVEDITAHKRHEAELVRAAARDPLTGLPNRTQVLRRLAQALDGAAAGTVAVLFCDVDRFKLVNDVHGHAVGDLLLCALAERIRDVVRGEDTVGRLGGDEFVVVAENLTSVQEIITLATRLIETVRRPVPLGATSTTPSVSVGIAVSEASAQPEQLLAAADTALYAAKGDGRGGWALFTSAMWEQANEALQLREELELALSRDELTVFYQPVIELAGGTIVGHEALLRWQHPARGLLLPGAFLELVLDTDLETRVTDLVLARAVGDLRRLPVAGPDRYVAVNLSPRQLGRPELPDQLIALLSAHGAHGGQLVLEATEGRLLAGPAQTTELSRLRELGVRLAIDDFGTGYGGLSYLQGAGADIVKIDRSFVTRVPDDRASMSIVTAVADLARVLGLTVIADGVETAEQRAAISALGVPFAQGYLFGRPAPLD